MWCCDSEKRRERGRRTAALLRCYSHPLTHHTPRGFPSLPLSRSLCSILLSVLSFLSSFLENKTNKLETFQTFQTVLVTCGMVARIGSSPSLSSSHRSLVTRSTLGAASAALHSSGRTSRQCAKSILRKTSRSVRLCVLNILYPILSPPNLMYVVFLSSFARTVHISFSFNCTKRTSDERGEGE